MAEYNRYIEDSISITDEARTRLVPAADNWRNLPRLSQPPCFTIVKEIDGTVAAETATDLTLENYPMHNAFKPGGPDLIAFYYKLADGAADDKATIQLLIFDSKLMVPKWVLADTAVDLFPNTIVELETHGASLACIRISAITFGGTRHVFEGRAAYILENQ